MYWLLVGGGGWWLIKDQALQVCCPMGWCVLTGVLRETVGWWMMRMLLFLGAVLGALGSEEKPSGSGRLLRDLHCPPCERIHCSSRRTLKLECKGGVTTGVCGCCPVCARTEGETCGGTWDYLGKCDEELVCVYQDAADDKPDAERTGICRAGQTLIYILRIKQARWLRWLDQQQQWGKCLTNEPTCRRRSTSVCNIAAIY